MSHIEDRRSEFANSALLILTLTAFLSGCTFLLQDTAPSKVAKLSPSVCPDLSGKYELGGTTIEKIPGLSEEKRGGGLLVGLLPTVDADKVDGIYEYFFNLNRPYQINFRKEKMPTYPRRFDYALDGNKTKGAYAELMPKGGNEFIVNVYSNSNQLLGTLQTKLLSNDSACHDGKYYSISDDSAIAGPIPDGFFTMARGWRTKVIYRSEIGELIVSESDEVRRVSLGFIPSTAKGIQHTTTFLPTN